jgi:hypothetical protein
MQSRTPRTDLPATGLPGCRQRSDPEPDAAVEEDAQARADSSPEIADTADFVVEWAIANRDPSER